MKIMELAMLIFTLAAVFCMGQYIGKRDGLYQGSWEYQNCINNGATGWYVEGNNFNCIF